MIKNFRTVAYVEAVSFLVLLCASFVKRVVEGPDLVPVVGMVHGIIFLIYVILVLKVRPEPGLGRRAAPSGDRGRRHPLRRLLRRHGPEDAGREGAD